MRLPVAFVVLLGAVLLAPPPGLASPSRVDVAFSLDQATLAPGSHAELAGNVTVAFPADADCEQDLDVRFVLPQTPPNATVTLQPLNWTIPAASVVPDGQAETTIYLAMDVAGNATAFDFLAAQVLVAVPACGNMQAAQHTVQLSPRVSFLPSADVRVADETASQWTIEIANTGNGALDVTWRLLQPSLGRVRDQGQLFADNPLSRPEGATVQLNLSKHDVDLDAPILFNATLGYGGPHTPIDPPVGHVQMELRSTVKGGPFGPVEAGIVVGILAALAIGGLALRSWRLRPGGP